MLTQVGALTVVVSGSQRVQQVPETTYCEVAKWLIKQVISLFT
jgi:hypothetical protein